MDGMPIAYGVQLIRLSACFRLSDRHPFSKADDFFASRYFTLILSALLFIHIFTFKEIFYRFPPPQMLDF